MTTRFLYSANDIVSEIGSGAVSSIYLRSLNIDETFVRLSSNIEFFHAGVLGSTFALSNIAGVVAASYNYEAFGRATITGISSSSFQFTGRENDGTGLYYYRARYYSPSSHRFISEDPYRLRGGSWNFFSYVGNNPVVRTDPTGLRCPCGEIPTQINAIGPGNALKVDQLRDQANMVAEATGLPGVGDGPQDAFRHCYWSCRMTQELGITTAKTVGDIHEECGDNKFMDYNNNLVGRTYGMSGTDCRIACQGAIRNGPLQLSP